MNQLVSSNFDLLRHHALGKNIRLENGIKEKLFVYSDEDMLHTVVRNLISNGIKFTPGGGEIKISARETDSFVEVRVSDTGIGIPEKDIPKLFRIDENVSRRGTANEEGTGLGLILCKEFIEKNGGEIWVESQPGKGSSFIFTLPVSNDS